MLNTNKVKIINFDLWDVDTGEADIIFKVSNLELKAFSLDDFSNDEEIKVILSIFPKEIGIVDKSTLNKCENISNNFQIELIGDIEEIEFHEEEGDFIKVKFEEILFLVFLANNIKDFKIGDKVKILGRLDIEKPII